MSKFSLISLVFILYSNISCAENPSFTSQGNDLIINDNKSSKVLKNLLSGFQNENIYISKFSGNPVIERSSESISKEKVIFTLNNDYSKIDCAYLSYYARLNHLLMGKAMCGLNKDISKDSIDNITDNLRDLSLNEGGNDVLTAQPIQQLIMTFNELRVFVVADTIDDLLNGTFKIKIGMENNNKTIEVDNYYIEFDTHHSPVYLDVYIDDKITKYSYEEMKSDISLH